MGPQATDDAVLKAVLSANERMVNLQLEEETLMAAVEAAQALEDKAEAGEEAPVHNNEGLRFLGVFFSNLNKDQGSRMNPPPKICCPKSLKRCTWNVGWLVILRSLF